VAVANNDEPQGATVNEGFIGRHPTFVPLGGIADPSGDVRTGLAAA
jgi:hypothetical protein